MLAVFSLGLLGAGGTALWAQTQRQGGYVNLGTTTYTVPGYAITSDKVGLHLASGSRDAASATRRHGTRPGNPGGRRRPRVAEIAPAGAAGCYLAGAEYATAEGTADHHGTYTEHAGSAPAAPPALAGIWTAQAAGPGTQTLTWSVKSGDWVVVAMNAGGSRRVSMRVNAAATLPALPWIATGLLIGGLVVLGTGIALRHTSVHAIARDRHDGCNTRADRSCGRAGGG